MLYTEPEKAHVKLRQCCFANNEDLGNAYNMRVYPFVYAGVDPGFFVR